MDPMAGFKRYISPRVRNLEIRWTEAQKTGDIFEAMPRQPYYELIQ